MKKIAILVIAALNQPVYRHYIRNYWTEVIGHTNASVPNIDVYLLIESGTPREMFDDLGDNVIEDQNADMDTLCDPKYQYSGMPGILSKTLFAFEQLQDRYDVFFRTNLSSLISVSALDEFVQNRNSITYSGAWAWTDALRNNLLHYGYVGPGKRIADLSELDRFAGNTFISGSGYFLSPGEVRHLLQRRQSMRYDIPDDVAVGLMMKDYELLRQFGAIVKPAQTLDEMVATIKSSNACHIRLQHFPVDKAEALWDRLKNDPIWR